MWLRSGCAIFDSVKLFVRNKWFVIHPTTDMCVCTATKCGFLVISISREILERNKVCKSCYRVTKVAHWTMTIPSLRSAVPYKKIGAAGYEVAWSWVKRLTELSPLDWKITKVEKIGPAEFLLAIMLQFWSKLLKLSNLLLPTCWILSEGSLMILGLLGKLRSWEIIFGFFILKMSLINGPILPIYPPPLVNPRLLRSFTEFSTQIRP